MSAQLLNQFITHQLYICSTGIIIDQTTVTLTTYRYNDINQCEETCCQTRSIGWLAGWLVGCLIGWLIGWFIGWFVAWSIDWFNNWLYSSLIWSVLIWSDSTWPHPIFSFSLFDGLSRGSIVWWTPRIADFHSLAQCWRYNWYHLGWPEPPEQAGPTFHL